MSEGKHDDTAAELLRVHLAAKARHGADKGTKQLFVSSVTHKSVKLAAVLYDVSTPEAAARLVDFALARIEDGSARFEDM